MRLCTERRKHQKKWARSYGRDFSSLFVGLHTFVCRSLHRAKEGLANRALGAGTAVSLCAASQGGKHGALRPQKPLRPIRDGEVRGREFYSHFCHHQNDSALRLAAVWAVLMFHYLCWQSHKTESINHHFWRGRRAEADRTEVVLLTSLAPYR